MTVAHPPRRDFAVSDMPAVDVYRLVTAAFIPRPIAWVSSLSVEGVANIAPHSFTTVAGSDPATLCFVSVGEKDSLRNVRATNEFVIALAVLATAREVNDSATPLPAEVSEFEAAGIETSPSALVAPPRPSRAPVAFECRRTGEYVIGSCVMTFGEIVHISIAEDVLAADGLPDAELLAPVTRLGRNQWAALGPVFDLARITLPDWQDGVRTEQPDLAGRADRPPGPA